MRLLYTPTALRLPPALLFFSLLCTCVLASCTDDFEEINTNTNEPGTAPPSLLLPAVLFDFADLGVTQNYVFGNVIAQYTANYEFNDLDLYDWTSDGRFWGIYGILQDVEDIRDFGERTGDDNYYAVATILRAYGISLITDAYGDAPFSEAGKADAGVFAPVYDTQESIYSTLLLELEAANDRIDVSESIEGDLLYSGDMLNWRRFANSLRLRLLLRSSNVSDNGAEMQEILDNPGRFPIFENNEHDAVYRYSGVLPNLSPFSAPRGRAYDYYLGVPTTHLIGSLQDKADPRLEVWFDPRAGTDDEYLGTAPGQTLGNVGRPADFASKAAEFFDRSDRIGSMWLTAAEIQFILAEAAQLGLITGGAEEFYAEGVKLSFARWGLTLPEGYLSAAAPYSVDNLHEQKWLALYHNSVQAWHHWRRTGKPGFIMAGPGTVNGGEVPVRLMYPAIEQSVNMANYRAAAENIGGDNVNSRVWWDR